MVRLLVDDVLDAAGFSEEDKKLARLAHERYAAASTRDESHFFAEAQDTYVIIHRLEYLFDHYSDGDEIKCRDTWRATLKASDYWKSIEHRVAKINRILARVERAVDRALDLLIDMKDDLADQAMDSLSIGLEELIDLSVPTLEIKNQ